MDEKGVFAIARSIWSDPRFDDEPFTEREAWMWLIGAAAWKAVRTRGNSGAVELKRGEFSFSVRFLMKKWKWENKDRVHRFIKRLEKRDSIRDTSRDGSQVYFILKYKEYQVVGLPNRDANCDTNSDASATAPRQHRDKEETLETLNIKTPEEDATPIGAAVAPKATPSKALFVSPAWLPQEAWDGFVEMRKRIRAPLTDRAKTLALRELEALRERGHDPTVILDQSTQNSWKGLFEPKAQNGTRNAKSSAHRNFLDAGIEVAREYLGGCTEGGDDSGAAHPPGRPLLSA